MKKLEIFSLTKIFFLFQFSGLPAETDPSGYSYLCPDGHLQPLDTVNPCIWVAKPWPAVAAAREHAEYVQRMLQTLSHDRSNSWENSLLSLLETYHVNISSLDTSIPIDDYLDQAVGFQSAYNFPSCSPPRSIVYCTTSIIQHYKCSWLQEASSVYGIEPNIQCIRAESTERCMDDAMHKVADVVLVNQDERIKAERDYNLIPLLYEYSSQLHERYITLAVVNSDVKVYNFSDLKGKRVCFPSFEGAAYLSVYETLETNRLIEDTCSFEQFFAADSCTWNPNRKFSCPEKYRNDEGALRCLVDGHGDVAFLNLDVFKNFTEGHLNVSWMSDVKSTKYKLVCPFGRPQKSNELCYLHWTPRGHLMINNGTSLIRKNEIYNSLRDMDKLFGKEYKSHTNPFTMFGPFDRKNNVMFRDGTDGLRSASELEKDHSKRLLEKTYTKWSKNRNCNIAQNRSTNLSSSIFLFTFIFSCFHLIKFVFILRS